MVPGSQNGFSLWKLRVPQFSFIFKDLDLDLDLRSFHLGDNFE